MEKCIGMMEVFIKVNGVKEYNMEKDRFMFLVRVTKREYSRTIL